MTAIASLLSTTAVTSPGLPAPASGATSAQLPGFTLPVIDLPPGDMPVVGLPVAGGRQAPAGSGNALPVQSDDEALAWLNVADARSSTLAVAHVGVASDDTAQATTRNPASPAVAPPRFLSVSLATATKLADRVPVDGLGTVAISTRAAPRDEDASDDVPGGRAGGKDEHDTSIDSAGASVLPVVLTETPPPTNAAAPHTPAAPMVGTEPGAIVRATSMPTTVDRSSAPRSDAAQPRTSIGASEADAPLLAQALAAAPRQRPTGPDKTTASVPRAAASSGRGRAAADTMPGEDGAAVTAPTLAHPRPRTTQWGASGSFDAAITGARSLVQPRQIPLVTASAGDADVAHAPSPASGPTSVASVDTPATVSTPPAIDLGEMSVAGGVRASGSRATIVPPTSVSLPRADLVQVPPVQAGPLSVTPASSAPGSGRPPSSDTLDAPSAFARTTPPITQTAVRAAGSVPSPSPAAPIARGASVSPVPVADTPISTGALLDPTERPAGLETAAPVGSARVASPATPPLASAQMAAIAAPPPVSAPAAQVFAAAIHRALGERDERPSSDPTALPMPVTATAAGLASVGAASQGALDMRHEHWPVAMIERIVTLRDMAAENDTRLRLSPDMLGTIDVSLRRDGDQVQVQITAEQAQTRQLLADAQPRLAELADARGVKLQLTGGHAGAGHSSEGQPGAGQPGTGGDAPGQQTPATPFSTRPRRDDARGEAADTDQRIA